MTTRTFTILAVLVGTGVLAGCSARDPLNKTPVYRVGTPTSRSTVYSWESNIEPFHTQPGVNGGKPVPPPRVIPSQLGFEPYDPLAEAVYKALVADGTIETQYLSPSAKKGVVILVGTLPSEAQKAHAESVARKTPGVLEVRDQIKVVNKNQ